MITNQKILLALFKFLFSIILLVYILNNFKFNLIFDFNSNKILTMILLLLVFINLCLTAFRLLSQLKLKGLNISSYDILRITFVGHFFSQVVPIPIFGEFVRIKMLKKKGITYSESLKLILVDRLNGFIFYSLTASFFLFIFLYLFYDISLYIICLGALSFFIFYKFFLFIKNNNFVYRLIQTLNKKFFIINFLLHCNVLLFYIFLSFNFEIYSYYLILLVPVISLLSFLPISYSGWGVREFISVYLLSLIGIDSNIALNLSIVYGLFEFINAFFAIFIYFIINLKGIVR